MNPILAETFMAVLILAYVFMGGVFIVSQKQGKTFVESFDKAFIWGGCLFVAGYGLDTVAYVTMA
jgi:hypothetical protein